MGRSSRPRLQTVGDRICLISIFWRPNFTTKRQSPESSEENTVIDSMDSKHWIEPHWPPHHQNEQRGALLFSNPNLALMGPHISNYSCRPEVTSCSSPCSSPITNHLLQQSMHPIDFLTKCYITHSKHWTSPWLTGISCIIFHDSYYSYMDCSDQLF